MVLSNTVHVLCERALALRWYLPDQSRLTLFGDGRARALLQGYWAKPTSLDGKRTRFLRARSSDTVLRRN